MGYIPQSFIEDLLSRIDIVDTINSYVSLRKAGRNYVACCPFHHEKTPSFCVVPDKQFYNCFGCGAAGSAIKFVMTIDNLDFVSTVEKLAASVGMEIPQSNNPNQKISDRYKLFYQILNLVTAYYQNNLSQNEQALDYIQKRSIDIDIAKFFLLGYAQDGWDNLRRNTKIADLVEQFNHNSQVKYSLEQILEDSGLWIKKTETADNNINGYDRFRNRLMFPIRDNKGRVIAFGGRVLDDSKPKYLNSPETLLFHKSAELYGLFEALQVASQNKTKLNKFVIVEGYMDVIALFQHGIYYSVATLGTASSYRHLAKLFKHCDEVIYCFDGDLAGRTAAWRALENSLSALYNNNKIKFLFLPEQYDPDSYIHEFGKHEFEQQLNNAISLPEYLFLHQAQVVGVDGLSTIEGRVHFVNLCKPLLLKVQDPTYRAILETELARRCDLNQSSLDKILVSPEDTSKLNQQLNHNNQINPINSINLINSRVRHNPSLWRKACALLIHNPKFFEYIPTDLINLLHAEAGSNRDQEILVFLKVYHLLTQVKTIPELIDSLSDSNNSDNSDLQNVVIKYLSDQPMINDELAEVEFKDLIKRLNKDQLASEMDSLKAKVSTSGMGSLSNQEKQRLQELLLDKSLG
ncbi:MAG: DNA primase [Gammaproteobacteria bacterium]|nr:DNA primase [Gammaproteobacteria bacterium]